MVVFNQRADLGVDGGTIESHDKKLSHLPVSDIQHHRDDAGSFKSANVSSLQRVCRIHGRIQQRTQLNMLWPGRT